MKYRTHECWSCDLDIGLPVRMSKNTNNLSGEATEYCPKCGKPFDSASPWFEVDRGEQAIIKGWEALVGHLEVCHDFDRNAYQRTYDRMQGYQMAVDNALGYDWMEENCPWPQLG